MITKGNYFSEVLKIKYSDLPSALKEGYDTIKFGSKEYSTWEYLEDDPEFLDVYFEKLNAFLKTGEKKVTSQKTEQKVSVTQNYKQSTRKNTGNKKAKKINSDVFDVVEKISPELRYIKRFISINGKSMVDKQILSFIKSMQKAITERQIRKTSQYAKEINYIQDFLIKFYNNMGMSKKLEIPEKKLKELTGIKEKYVVNPAVSYIKRFINLYNNQDDEKLNRLLNSINRAIENNAIPNKSEADKAIYKELQKVKKKLNAFSNNGEEITISQQELKGFIGIASCHSKKASSSITKKNGLSGTEILSIYFQPLGFKGRWRELFGNPEKMFHTLIWGGEGSGKSTMAIEFANYLASELYQKVCYYAIEQKYSSTLQSIILRLNATHPGIEYRKKLGSDHQNFDFVFFDSITALDLKYNDLKYLQDKNPNTCFVYIVHALKDNSNYRGERRIGHLADIIVKIERINNDQSIAMIDGKNRFGGKGAIKINFTRD